MTTSLVLVTGATGYIGGRLIPRLLEAGYAVRAMARSPERLDLHPWRSEVEVVQGDALDAESVKAAAAGASYAYYLIHSMDGTGNFSERDAAAARNFRDAAEAAGMKRIVYLGGMGEERDDLSPHLTSRHEVGRILASGPTPVSELRAAVIIGSGSVSFEMLRYLTEVLPVMTTPSWVRTRCQPVAIRDILSALVSSLEDEGSQSSVEEIGGPDVLTYEEMMHQYAEVAGLRRRRIIPVPVLSPGLSSRWVGLVTPLPVGVARPLIDSLRNEVVIRPERGFEPQPKTTYRESVELALESSRESSLTRWSDSAGPAAALPTDPDWSGGTLLSNRQQVETTADPDALFGTFSRVGGSHGYFTMDFLWHLRGWLDQLVGGIGLRRGRRHPIELRPGEAVDFWRVENVEPPRRLRLRAEMRLPGVATLEWTAREAPGGGAILTQEALFRPRGLSGRLYWYALYPAHVLIFGRMARKIATAAEDQALMEL